METRSYPTAGNAFPVKAGFRDSLDLTSGEAKASAEQGTQGTEELLCQGWDACASPYVSQANGDTISEQDLAAPWNTGDWGPPKGKLQDRREHHFPMPKEERRQQHCCVFHTLIPRCSHHQGWDVGTDWQHLVCLQAFIPPSAGNRHCLSDVP